MSYCNVPQHANRLKFLRRCAKTEARKKSLVLPLWTKDYEGRPPRELVLQVFCEGKLEIEVALRPCKGCWRRIIYGILGIRRAKFEALAPDFFAYLPVEPDSMVNTYFSYRKKFNKTREWVRLVLQEIEERYGVPLQTKATPRLIDPKAPLWHAQRAAASPESLKGKDER